MMRQTRRAAGSKDASRGESPELNKAVANVSTDNLHLEWTLGASSSSTLRVVPNWNPRRPIIDVWFETTCAGQETIPIEAVIPEGWAWLSISITGEGLRSWRSIDGDWWDDQPPEDLDSEDEDSFSTIRQRRPLGTPSKAPRPSLSSLSSSTYSSVSLLRQTKPAQLDEMDEFSFEQGSSATESPVKRPVTPLATPRQQTPRRAAVPRRSFGNPSQARYFNLSFDGPSRGFTMTGTLVPMSNLTLVGPHIPVSLPFVKLDFPSAPTTCQVSCDRAVDLQTSEIDGLDQVDLSTDYIGELKWNSDVTPPLPSVTGDVFVELSKNDWGVITASVLVPRPRHDEVILDIASTDTRIISSTFNGVPSPLAVSRRRTSTRVRLGRPPTPIQGDFSVVLELQARNRIALPSIAGKGKMRVRLGDGWEGES